ncbi:hypothetical protein Q3G72_003626 [Acer saccharum]|nr:hypothetical protein Q3G72_003626 [Acer saccharum]
MLSSLLKESYAWSIGELAFFEQKGFLMVGVCGYSCSPSHVAWLSFQFGSNSDAGITFPTRHWNYNLVVIHKTDSSGGRKFQS